MERMFIFVIYNMFMKRFFVLFFTLLICSCCERAFESSLRSAETLIQSSPDSALVLLLKIDPNNLESPKTKAKYALPTPLTALPWTSTPMNPASRSTPETSLTERPWARAERSSHTAEPSAWRPSTIRIHPTSLTGLPPYSVLERSITAIACSHSQSLSNY